MATNLSHSAKTDDEKRENHLTNSCEKTGTAQATGETRRRKKMKKQGMERLEKTG